MADLSKVLGGPWTPPTEKRVTPPEEQLIDAMRGAGLELETGRILHLSASLTNALSLGSAHISSRGKILSTNKQAV